MKSMKDRSIKVLSNPLYFAPTVSDESIYDFSIRQGAILKTIFL